MSNNWGNLVQWLNTAFTTPNKGRTFFVQTGSGARLAFCPMGPESFSGVSAAGCDADHSPLSSAEPKNV